MKFFSFFAVLLTLCFCLPNIAYSDNHEALVEQFTKDARETIDIGVTSIMQEMDSPHQLEETVNLFVRTWNDWEKSKLFVLKDDKDIDVYGNLYSLQVMCRTLLLAAIDWNRMSPGERSDSLLQKAQWLDKRSQLLADPVAEILKRQSYSDVLKLRVEVMVREFPYVEVLYGRSPFLGNAG